MITSLDINIQKGIIHIILKTFNSKEYEQRVQISDGRIINWNCECRWGSIGRWQGWAMKEDKKCRHMLEGIKLLKYLKYLRFEEKE
jgi:hypothetical protein